jgi:cytochrome c oxidase assembly protein subunit 15
MVAATVGLLTLIQAIWLQRRERKRILRILGWCALGAVIMQGLLGGLTVLLLLPKSISIAHAGLAEIFFCMNLSIAFFASNAFAKLRTYDKGDAPVTSTTALVAVVYAQILVGALMRHLGAGLAIPEVWVVPSFTSTAVIVNFAHRAGGVLVAAMIVTIAIRLRRFETNHSLRIIANFLVVFVAAQIMLGAYTVWSGKQPYITSLHVMAGALILGTSLLLALTARTLAWRTHARLIEVPA